MANRGELILLIVVILVAQFLTACAGIQTKRESYVQAHPALPQNVKQAIAQGNVVQGMTSDQVKASWGEPANSVREITTNGHVVERWTYAKLYRDYLNYYEVRFDDDVVREVRLQSTQKPSAAAPQVQRVYVFDAPADVENAKRFLRLRRDLGLTQEQVQRLEAIRESYKSSYQQKQDAITAARTELGPLYQDSFPDTFRIRDKLEELGRLQSDLRLDLVGALQEANNVLTVEQQQLLRRPTPPPPAGRVK